MDYIHFLIDFILHIDVHLAYLIANYGTWVYVILFCIIFMETGLVITPFLPGDSMIFVAGALAARGENDFNVWILALTVSLAAIVGDSANFEIGKKLGKKLFSNPNSKIFKQKYLEKTHEFYSIHGGKTLILARFIPIIRTFAPFVGGMGKMHYKYFISYNIIGGIAWAFLFSFLGYSVGNIKFVQENLKGFLVSIIILSLIPAFSELISSKLKSRKKNK